MYTHKHGTHRNAALHFATGPFLLTMVRLHVKTAALATLVGSLALLGPADAFQYVGTVQMSAFDYLTSSCIGAYGMC